MKKAETLTIGLLVVTLLCSMYLLLKPEPSTEPIVSEPIPAVENTNPSPVAEVENAE